MPAIGPGENPGAAGHDKPVVVSGEKPVLIRTAMYVGDGPSPSDALMGLGATCLSVQLLSGALEQMGLKNLGRQVSR